MSSNESVTAAQPPKSRFRSAAYAATLLIGGGLIGAIAVGPTLGQGPDGPRWQRGMGMGMGDDDHGSDGQRWQRHMGDDEDGFDGPRGRRHMGGDEHESEGPRWGRGGDDRDGQGWRRGFGERFGEGFRERMRERMGEMGERMGEMRERMGGMRERMGEMRGRGFGMFPGAIERRVDRVLGMVDASTEQKQKVRAIYEAAANDLYTLRQQRQEGRRAIMAALAEATIDRSKIEQLRTQQMQAADAISKRLTTALADAAEVLTPAQRAELAKRMERWHRG